jgi:hypothetical protein
MHNFSLILCKSLTWHFDRCSSRPGTHGTLQGYPLTVQKLLAGRAEDIYTSCIVARTMSLRLLPVGPSCRACLFGYSSVHVASRTALLFCSFCVSNSACASPGNVNITSFVGSRARCRYGMVHDIFNTVYEPTAFDRHQSVLRMSWFETLLIMP